MDKLKLVKTAVFVLTFLLVFGSLLFLGTLFKQTRKNQVDIPATINLDEPQGSLIQKFEQNNGILYLLVQGGGMEDRIVIFDTNQGKKITTLQINQR